MQHAIARQAEAERERRAKIINAEGEYQAAAKLGQAADVIGRNPVTIQLRYLQTLREIGSNQNSTIVFPMPIDLVKPMMEVLRGGGEAQTADDGGNGEVAPEQLPVAPGLELGIGESVATPDPLGIGESVATPDPPARDD
jgi:hypothetical protein